MYLQLGSLGRPSPSRDYLAMAGGSVALWPCPGHPPRAGAGGARGGSLASVPKNKSAQQSVFCLSCTKFGQEELQLPFSMQVLQLHPALVLHLHPAPVLHLHPAPGSPHKP